MRGRRVILILPRRHSCSFRVRPCGILNSRAVFLASRPALHGPGDPAFNVGVPRPSAVRALTGGAIAVMILAVNAVGHARAYRRALTLKCATVAVFVLINAAAAARVCATWHTALMASLLLIAGALWTAAFAIFELVYGPVLLTPRAES